MSRMMEQPCGLTGREAAEKQKQYGENRLTEGKKVHPFAVFISQFKDFLTLVLLGGTVVSVLTGGICRSTDDCRDCLPERHYEFCAGVQSGENAGRTAQYGGAESTCLAGWGADRRCSNRTGAGRYHPAGSGRPDTGRTPSFWSRQGWRRMSRC